MSPYAEVCARFTPGVPLAVLLFQMDNLPHKPPCRNVRAEVQFMGDEHEYPLARKPGTVKSVQNCLKKRIARYEFMKNHGQMSVAQIDSILRIGPEHVRRQLLKLIDSGHVASKKEGRTKVVYWWVGE